MCTIITDADEHEVRWKIEATARQIAEQIQKSNPGVFVYPDSINPLESAFRQLVNQIEKETACNDSRQRIESWKERYGHLGL